MSLIFPLAAGAVTFLLLRWMLSRPHGAIPLDHPNERSLHTQPVPRVGGMAICIGALPVLATVWSPLVAGIAAALALVSYMDDKRHLPIKARFVAHIVAAGLLMTTMESVTPWPMLAMGALATAWMINLYNFMDGSDGLAGGMTLIGFGAYAVASFLADSQPLALGSATIAVCSVAFLYFNLHPARTFLGDAGSVPLGFLAAAIGFIGWRDGAWPWWFPLVVFSPFIVDATATLVRRMLAGERFWAAHRSHYYQRLVQLGWGHRKTANAEFALMLACAAIGLVTVEQPVQTQVIVLAAVALSYIFLALAIGRLWKSHVSVTEAP